MIDLHYAPTPNGSKISIMLEVQARLAIGKFVKEPFDEEARAEHVRAESEGNGREKISRRLAVIACDKREAFAHGSAADEAIHTFFGGAMDCFASLAMTVGITSV